MLRRDAVCWRRGRVLGLYPTLQSRLSVGPKPWPRAHLTFPAGCLPYLWTFVLDGRPAQVLLERAEHRAGLRVCRPL